MVKIVNETQVEFVCTSRVFKLRRGVFLEERHLAVYTNRSKQGRHETGDEVLNDVVARLCVYEKGNHRAYLVSADVGRSLPVVQCAFPKIKLQSPKTPTQMRGVSRACHVAISFRGGRSFVVRDICDITAP